MTRIQRITLARHRRRTQPPQSDVDFSATITARALPGETRMETCQRIVNQALSESLDEMKRLYFTPGPVIEDAKAGTYNVTGTIRDEYGMIHRMVAVASPDVPVDEAWCINIEKKDRGVRIVGLTEG